MYSLTRNVIITRKSGYRNSGNGWLNRAQKAGPRFRITYSAKLIDANDPLAKWLKKRDTEMRLIEHLPTAHFDGVLTKGYAAGLREDELKKVGEDATLIAFAMVSVSDRRIVTTEHSRPKRVRANRHIPDVCNTLGVSDCNTFQMLGELDFSTSWRRG